MQILALRFECSGNDSDDVRVECLLSALGHDEDRDDRFTQPAFAARDLPACTVCASYSRGAMMTPVEAFEETQRDRWWSACESI